VKGSPGVQREKKRYIGSIIHSFNRVETDRLAPCQKGKKVSLKKTGGGIKYIVYEGGGLQKKEGGDDDNGRRNRSETPEEGTGHSPYTAKYFFSHANMTVIGEQNSTKKCLQKEKVGWGALSLRSKWGRTSLGGGLCWASGRWGGVVSDLSKEFSV